MLRKLMLLLTILSLLLCAATVTLWVRSYRDRGDERWFTDGADTTRYLVTSETGTVTLLGPPAIGPGDAAARAVVQQMRNTSVRLMTATPVPGQSVVVMNIYVCGNGGIMSMIPPAD